MAGTTHDPIDSELICFGRRITLIDTAGIRKRSIGILKFEFFKTMKSIFFIS